ncbi:hypothetical protein CB1_000745002 [Camelus ferus]|nr:hypothetical protein CB1_000745002 [Camelus ferus]
MARHREETQMNQRGGRLRFRSQGQRPSATHACGREMPLGDAVLLAAAGRERAFLLVPSVSLAHTFIHWPAKRTPAFGEVGLNRQVKRSHVGARRLAKLDN